MFLLIFAALLVGASCVDLVDPQFRVLTPSELIVKVPDYGNMELITFQIGFRKNSHIEELELGENDMNNNAALISDNRIKLKKGDIVDYLLAFRDTKGYRALTGMYIFDGVYGNKSFSRRHRFRRTLGYFKRHGFPPHKYGPFPHGQPLIVGRPNHHYVGQDRLSARDYQCRICRGICYPYGASPPEILTTTIRTSTTTEEFPDVDPRFINFD